jgi:hypothetical protein
MRRLTFVILAAFLALSPALVSTTVNAADAGGISTAGPIKMHQRLLVAGAGAIIGIVVFNMLTYPMGSVPFVAAPLAATPVDIALGSRFLAAMVGGTAALAAHYMYTATTKQ